MPNPSTHHAATRTAGHVARREEVFMESTPLEKSLRFRTCLTSGEGARGSLVVQASACSAESCARCRLKPAPQQTFPNTFSFTFRLMLSHFPPPLAGEASGRGDCP